MDIRNFELIVDNLEKNPHCLHGPTLIFQENVGKMKHYYGCSACRDKKSCNFYLPVNEKTKILHKTSDFWKRQQQEMVSSIKKSNPHKKLIKIMSSFQNVLKNDKMITSKGLKSDIKSESSYCYTCNCLFEKSSYAEHTKCNTKADLSYYQLTHPTSIIIPKTDAKTHAQFFFSESSVSDICLLLTKLKATKLLCIGVPKIHEFVVVNPKYKMKSLLLDFDKNYFNFYSRNEFIWYNMFNNHIFDETQQKVLHKFLQSGKIVVLMDPPFGGRVEPLAETLKKLSNKFVEVNGELSKGEDGEINNGSNC